MIKVSIIIPVYNAEKYIRETLDSLLEQDIDKEIIAVNDGSTDLSLQILKEYNQKNRCFKYINQTNMGATFARNNGLKEATGEYIFFFDADDLLKPNSLKYMISKMEKENADLLISDYELIDSEEKKLGINRYGDLSQNVNIKHYLITPFPGNKIFKRTIILDNNICFDPVRIGQDLNFYLKYLIFCRKVAVYKKNCTSYRVLPMSISNSYDDRVLDIIKSIDYVMKFYGNCDVSYEIRRYMDYVKISNYVFQMSKISYYEDIVLKINIVNALSAEVERAKKKIKVKSLFEFKILIYKLKEYKKYIEQMK